jgi:hypothetical protein
MDRGKPHPAGLLDVCQRVVDERDIPAGLPILSRAISKISGSGLMAHFARDDNVIEQVEKIIFLACNGKRFCRPVAQSIERISRLLEPFHDLDCACKGLPIESFQLS